MKTNQIYNEDCLKGLKKIKSDSIDLIISDPPYLVSRKSNFHTMKDRKNQRTGVDLGKWDYDFSNEDWIKECSRVLKPGGSLIAFNDFKKASEINELCEENTLTYKDTIIWQKSNPMPRNRDRRYAPAIEMIQWFVKPKNKWVFNRQDEKYEVPILKFPSESGGGFKRYHPTQKPIALLKTLINIHSNEGAVVLDPFMGSGATAVACLNTGRSYIGFEVDKDYHQISIERIKSINT